jgi:uncharacterized protein YkwD
MMSPPRASTRNRTIAARALIGLVLIAVLASCRPLNSAEAHLFGETNALRTSSGLPGLAQHDELTDQARSWAATLAAQGSLQHSDPKTWRVRWQAVAENVGVGSSIEQVTESLIASDGHRRNMLSTSYTHMAVGTARGKDGRIYAVQLFWRG